MSFPEYSTDEDAIYAIWQICVQNFSVQSRIQPVRLARAIETLLSEYVGGDEALTSLVREKMKSAPDTSARS